MPSLLALLLLVAPHGELRHCHPQSKRLIKAHRFILPIKKFRLTEEQLEEPIPTLSDRQFVVDKSGLSLAEARLQRELFWYREELFKAITGQWQEVSHFTLIFVIH